MEPKIKKRKRQRPLKEEPNQNETEDANEMEIENFDNDLQEGVSMTDDDSDLENEDSSDQQSQSFEYDIWNDHLSLSYSTVEDKSINYKCAFDCGNQVPSFYFQCSQADILAKYPVITHEPLVPCNAGVCKALAENLTLNKKENALVNTFLQASIRYADVLCARQPSAFDRDEITMDDLRQIYCMQALNHVLRTRNLVIKNNLALREMNVKPDDMDGYRDRGVMRPKVLILTPFRNDVLKIVDTMKRLLFGDKPANQKQIQNMKRFKGDFQQIERDSLRSDMPEDHRNLFAGNIDDRFRLGIGIAKKNLKLYVKLEVADIIIASPLGLRQYIGAEGDKSRKFDCLSSIELLIMDKADIFLMQNWSHVLHIMQHLHKTPLNPEADTDFGRVRLWELDGLGKYYRQTIMLTSIITPELRSIFSKYSFNYAGRCEIPPNFNGRLDGCLPEVRNLNSGKLALSFTPLDVDTLMSLPNKRFDYFTSKLMPKHLQYAREHCLVVVPSYYDYLRLKHYLSQKEIDISHVTCDEYSSNDEISKARGVFFHGKCRLMVITERFHFYKRYNLRGVHHVLFYSPPMYPHLFAELCSLTAEPLVTEELQKSVVHVLYSKFDSLTLIYLVGKNRAQQLLKSDTSIVIKA